MNDYDYLNARIRGMAAALFSRETYEQILAGAAESLLVDTLLASSYGQELQAALEAMSAAPHRPVYGEGSAMVGASQLRAIESALAANLRATFAKIRGIAPPEPFRLLTLLMNRWDLSNITTLIRARLAGASSQEVLEAVMPVGQYDAPQLGDLAMESDLRDLADALASWGYAVAFMARRTLLDALALADPLAAERELLRAYFAWALGQLRERDRNQAILRDVIRREIDLANVVSLLQRIQQRQGEAAAGEGASTEAPSPSGSWEVIPRGRLSGKITRELARCDTLDEAFELLEETYFAPAVERGILDYGQTRSLSVMEWMLQRVVIEHGCRLFRLDNLSVSVPIGFLWRKYAELANLRILARGRAYRVPANAVKELLILV